MKTVSKSAVKVAIFENSDPISAETETIQARISRRAHEISKHRPHDAHQRYDWNRAESEIISIPPAELIEREGKFELKFALAGIDPGDVTLMLTANQVVLKAESAHQHESDLGSVHFCDFRSATVFRSIPLPHSIDVKSVKVSFSGGILLLSAAKAGAERPALKRAASMRKASAAKASPSKS